MERERRMREEMESLMRRRYNLWGMLIFQANIEEPLSL